MSLYHQQQQNSQLHGDNAAYIEALYEQFLDDPDSLSLAWQQYFQNIRANSQQEVSRLAIQERFEALAQLPFTVAGGENALSEKQLAVFNLIQAYREYGHLVAQTDPIPLRERPAFPLLDYRFYGLNEQDLNQTFHTEALHHGAASMSLKDLIAFLQKSYCGSIGAECHQVIAPEERQWLQQRLEALPAQKLNQEQQKTLLKQLVSADGLEKYLHQRYVGQKRFSLEGGDGLIPLMHALIERLGERGVKELGIGMAHRGRLNMLINILGKAPADLFAEFEGKISISKGAGDVKYHMGYASVRQTAGGAVDLSLAYNPSHLEFVNPVVQGSTRARLDRPEALPQAAMAVQIHGDAAFANQGIIQESLQLSQVRGYRCGGVIHIIVNNQIGFTTSNLLDARSSLYASDPAKIIQAPVLHVNGDDPEALYWAAQLAADYSHQFQKDIVLDLLCYRRLGHNEADEPAATQPLMYQKIRAHAVPAAVYAQKLEAAQVIDADFYPQAVQDYRAALEAGAPVAATEALPESDVLRQAWQKLSEQDWTLPVHTAVDAETLSALGEKIFSIPNDFKAHPIVTRTYEARREMSAGKQALDWGTAENLAYASLLNDGFAVRLSGEDCGRGTFSHRHAVIHNQNTGESYTPLAHLSASQPRVTIIDSTLSENAVLGFEYGYSTSAPNSLTIWEAQFGDFANGAQVIIDQFIASGETKWGRYSGLVMLLPHGYEGQGPEHSSARLERYLQLSADQNWQVCVPSTPAQIFHLLRRQMLRTFRKPLVIISPKSLLRHKLAVSELQELSQGQFQEVYPEIDTINPKQVKRVVLCSGKVYYDLLQKRREEALSQIAIIRLEQLYPFPTEALQSVLSAYSPEVEIVWCQEEPRNQGAWRNIYEALAAALGHHRIHYAGRPESASTAVGYAKVHAQEQSALVEAALEAVFK